MTQKLGLWPMSFSIDSCGECTTWVKYIFILVFQKAEMGK